MAQETNPQQQKPFRGLYRNVNISVRALDCIILACIAVIILVAVTNLSNPGYTTVFDSRGGTDVVAQKAQYGELLTPPEPPTREGYVFSGWFRDPTCDLPWDFAQDKIEQEQTLYAAWLPAAP